MAELLEFPPPVTGQKPGMVRLDAYDVLLRRHETQSLVLRQVERERDDYAERCFDYAEAIAEGRLVGPAAFWSRMALCAASFLLIGWLLGGLGL